MEELTGGTSSVFLILIDYNFWSSGQRLSFRGMMTIIVQIIIHPWNVWNLQNYMKITVPVIIYMEVQWVEGLLRINVMNRNVLRPRKNSLLTGNRMRPNHLKVQRKIFVFVALWEVLCHPPSAAAETDLATPPGGRPFPTLQRNTKINTYFLTNNNKKL